MCAVSLIVAFIAVAIPTSSVDFCTKSPVALPTRCSSPKSSNSNLKTLLMSFIMLSTSLYLLPTSLVTKALAVDTVSFIVSPNSLLLGIIP